MNSFSDSIWHNPQIICVTLKKEFLDLSYEANGRGVLLILHHIHHFRTNLSETLHVEKVYLYL